VTPHSFPGVPVRSWHCSRALCPWKGRGAFRRSGPCGLCGCGEICRTYVRRRPTDRETIAEQQARLDAVAHLAEHAFGIGSLMREELRVLARGTPRRECAKLVKRYLTAEQVKELMRQGARGAAELHETLKRQHAEGWARSRNLVVR